MESLKSKVKVSLKDRWNSACGRQLWSVSVESEPAHDLLFMTAYPMDCAICKFMLLFVYHNYPYYFTYNKLS